jgi:hypothetical protein
MDVARVLRPRVLLDADVAGADIREPVLAAFAGRDVLDVGRVQHCDANLGEEVLILLPSLDVDRHEQDGAFGALDRGLAEIKRGEFLGDVSHRSAAETEVALDALHRPTPSLVGPDALGAVSVRPFAPLSIGTGPLQELPEIVAADLGCLGQVVIWVRPGGVLDQVHE